MGSYDDGPVQREIFFLTNGLTILGHHGKPARGLFYARQDFVGPPFGRQGGSFGLQHLPYFQKVKNVSEINGPRHNIL